MKKKLNTMINCSIRNQTKIQFVKHKTLIKKLTLDKPFSTIINHDQLKTFLTIISPTKIQ